MVEKKLSSRGRDLSGEIRAEILHRTPLRMSKTVGWRPDWCQKGVIWGPLGFRAALAHPNQPTNQSFFFIIASHVWPSLCLSQGPIWSIFSSSSAMCGRHVSQFGLICFILIRFSKQWFQLGDPPMFHRMKNPYIENQRRGKERIIGIGERRTGGRCASSSHSMGTV